MADWLGRDQLVRIGQQAAVLASPLHNSFKIMASGRTAAALCAPGTLVAVGRIKVARPCLKSKKGCRQ